MRNAHYIPALVRIRPGRETFIRPFGAIGGGVVYGIAWNIDGTVMILILYRKTTKPKLLGSYITDPCVVPPPLLLNSVVAWFTVSW